MERRSSAAVACLGKAVTPLCRSLGSEHPIFWAEREAGLTGEVQGEDAGDAQVMVPANPCWWPGRTVLANPFGAAAANLQTIPHPGVGCPCTSDMLVRGAAFPHSTPAPLCWESPTEREGMAFIFRCLSISLVKPKLLKPPGFVQAVRSLEGGEPAKTYLYRTLHSRNLQSVKNPRKNQ